MATDETFGGDVPCDVQCDVHDHVATVTLARPPVNALNRSARAALTRVFDELGDRTDVRAIVLTGVGRVFCAGADIKERHGLDPAPGEYGALNRLVREMFYAVLECPKPVICAVNGAALGAGFALALCCDLLLASDEAVFGMPEIDVGLAGGVKFLQRHLTPGMARRLLLTGERIAAQKFEQLGVVQQCVPAAELLPRAQALAAQIAAKSPLAVRMLKESFNLVENLSLRDGYRIEQGMTMTLSRSDDAREAQRAFVEKRPPRFTGR